MLSEANSCRDVLVAYQPYVDNAYIEQFVNCGIVVSITSSVHIWRLCRKYGKMLGVNMHPHTFRHSCAIYLIRNGVDLRRLQQLVGHSNIQTTTVYLQFRDQDLREVYNKVEF
jgi:site-specific recombinase XerD